MQTIVRWMGTAHVELRSGNDVLLLDPYCSRPDKREVFFRPLRPRMDRIRSYVEGIQGTVRAIAVGHTHFDHALDIPETARLTGAAVLGSASLDTLLTLSGLPGRVTVCSPHKPYALGNGMALTMIPSRHGLILSRLLLLEGEIDGGCALPLRFVRYRLGAMHAIMAEMGGTTFLHVGSAGFSEDALKNIRCDVLFLCVSGWKNTPGYPEQLLEMVQPSCVVPIHHDDFTLPLMEGRPARILKSADLGNFMMRLRTCRPGMEVRLLEPLGTTTFS